ncbi:alpha/beta hydrolase [Streptomyces sp. NPDC057486]|uniref:alpha/beta hydrolase n=1 Tax=Streptomyces sp. NPDC057486 TaxID=3346145 RepID=UPI0036B25BAD
MYVTSETTSNGVSERPFTHDGISGLLRPPVTRCSFAVAAIDAPGHGNRQRIEQDGQFAAGSKERMSAGEPIGPLVTRHNTSPAARAVPKWQSTPDALQDLDHVGASGRVGFWGVSLGSEIGVPSAAAEPRITATDFGCAGHETLAEAAAQVTVPVKSLLQWDDEPVPRDVGLAFFDAFASREKTLHTNPGRHAGIPAFGPESSQRFFARHLVRDLDAP